MGHYDEQYEADADRREKSRRIELTHWIHKEIEGMNSTDLELIYDIARDVESYQTFFAILNISRG
jgi:hypothetical protein